MTLNPGWFLNATGQFTPVAGASTSSSTSMFTVLTKSSTADVTLTTTAFQDGPSVAQGSSGIWYASGTVTFSTTGAANTDVYVKLYDGTNVFAAAAAEAFVNNPIALSVSGVITSPAGNIRIAAANSAADGHLAFNLTGFSADCTVTAIRIG